MPAPANWLKRYASCQNCTEDNADFAKGDTLTMKSHKHQLALLLSAVIPAAALLLLFMLPHITQGQYTLLVSDLNGQYVNYFLYFKEAISKGDNLFYSFSMLLGGDTFSLIGYYLLSPLNLILLLWPASRIASGIFTIIVIKASLSGLTAYLYFSRKRKHAFYPLIFSTTYALGGYLFAYFMHVMWLDALYMLPLVILGLELLIKEKKTLLYTVSLAASIIFCYYTGYMIAGFSLVYFIYFQIREKQSFKIRAVSFFRFCAASILGAALSAITLFPTLLSQMGNRQAQTEVQNGILHSMPELLAKLFSGVFSAGEFAEGAPQIYCGMFILFLVIVLLISIKGNVRDTISAVFLLGTLTACFSFGILDKVWHGMAMPNNFTHRYAFVFIFSCVLLAEECFSSESLTFTLPKLFLADAVIIAIGAWVYLAQLEQVDTLLLAIDIAVVLLISVLFYFYKNGAAENQFAFLSVIAAIQLAQLLINGTVYIGLHNYDDHSTEGYYSAVKPVIEEVQAMDDDFYRMEKYYYNSQNDAMMLSYNGLSHFSSADKSYIRSFMGNIGYNKNYDFWVYYDKGATPAADSFLGLKYILSNEPVDYFTEKAAVQTQTLYENPLALQIGTVCSDSLKALELTEDAPFENQEAIYNAMLSVQTGMFSSYEISEPELTNLLMENDTYVKSDSDADGIIRFQFIAKDSNPVYMYLPSVYNPGIQVCVDGENLGEYLVTYHRGIMSLGTFEEGEPVTVELYLHGLHAGFKNIQIYSLDMEKLAEATAALQTQGWTVSYHNSGNIFASFTAEDDDSMLLMTIPYNDNWRIKIDGAPVSATQVLGALMAVDVDAGAHTIEMHYTPAGLYIGCAVSGCALLILCIIACSGKKAQRKKKKSPPAVKAAVKQISQKEISSKQIILPKERRDRRICLIQHDRQEAEAKAVQKFLDMQYHGHCQICSKQFTDEKGNPAWYTFSLFQAEEDTRKAVLPAAWDRICVCFTCKAMLQYSEVSMKDFLTEALSTPPYKSERKYKFKISIKNEPAGITYTTKHLQHLQAALTGEDGKQRLRYFRYKK